MATNVSHLVSTLAIPRTASVRLRRERQWPSSLVARSARRGAVLGRPRYRRRAPPRRRELHLADDVGRQAFRSTDHR